MSQSTAESTIEEIVQLQLGLMRGTGLGRRGQHPKQHGVVAAQFEVLADLPEALKVGLFARPATYTAYIRFSNGAQVDDTKPDVHGMAIKLTGVPGRKLLDGEADATTHDFVLTDHPVFFIRGRDEYLRFIQDFARTVPLGKKPLRFLLWLLFHHPRDLLVLARFNKQVQDSPLAAEYFSQVPYAFGAGAVCRYGAVPHPGNLVAAIPKESRGPEYLLQAMRGHVTEAARPAVFDFTVQVRTDAGPEVVDNSTVRWSVPAQPVARITIPAQTFDSPEQMQFCENLSFTPWHALPEHRPVGEINAIRRAVYVASSKLRHSANQLPRSEPAGTEHLGFNALRDGE